MEREKEKVSDQCHNKGTGREREKLNKQTRCQSLSQVSVSIEWITGVVS